MSRKSLLVTAPLALGALVLLWAAMAVRGEPEPKPVRPAPKAAPAKRTAPPVESAVVDPPAAPVAPRPASSTPSSGGEFAVIEERIRVMEEKLLALETRKAEILASNQDLERQIADKQSEFTARSMAEARVRQWEHLLGLTETQKQSLIDLCTKWAKEDAVRAPGRDTWFQRENDLRARLSAEQAGRLHDSVAKQSQQMWGHLGRSLAAMAGAPKEDHLRFQQTLGTWSPETTMLLPEGHGADWPGMMKEGISRLQPLLTAEQLAKLSRFQR